MDDQQTAADRPPIDVEGQADDVEGHSLPIILGLGQAERNRHQARSRKGDEETLPPITKPFPRLRDDSKRT